jgi:hypothetical protein
MKKRVYIETTVVSYFSAKPSRDITVVGHHLNNPFTRKRVRQIVEGEGYGCPEICSPEELLEVDT